MIYQITVDFQAVRLIRPLCKWRSKFQAKLLKTWTCTSGSNISSTSCLSWRAKQTACFRVPPHLLISAGSFTHHAPRFCTLTLTFLPGHYGLLFSKDFLGALGCSVSNWKGHFGEHSLIALFTARHPLFCSFSPSIFQIMLIKEAPLCSASLYSRGSQTP